MTVNIRGNLTIILAIFFAFIIGGSFIYSSIEGWHPLDSFYFVVMTVTTIGYGDFVPVTSTGKILTIFFAFFGVATALYLLSSVSSALFKKHVSQRVSEIKRDVKKDVEIKEEVKDTIKEAISKKKKRKSKR